MKASESELSKAGRIVAEKLVDTDGLPRVVQLGAVGTGGTTLRGERKTLPIRLCRSSAFSRLAPTLDLLLIRIFPAGKSNSFLKKLEIMGF